MQEGPNFGYARLSGQVTWFISLGHRIKLQNNFTTHSVGRVYIVSIY